MSPDHAIRGKDAESDPARLVKLNQLKDDLRARYTVAYYKSAEELGRQVFESLSRLQSLHPELTGIPAVSRPLDPVSPIPNQAGRWYIAHPYLQTHTFFGRKAELAKLDAWAASEDPMLVVEAIGGMGKSALLWKWLKERAETAIPNLAGVIWWSFYESEASMGKLISSALAYVTRSSLADNAHLHVREREQALLDELRTRPYLLVLDGLERILVAYHRLDAPHLSDEQMEQALRQGQGYLRNCIDPRHGTLLQEFAASFPSKVLVSTRLVPRELQDPTGYPQLGVRVEHLAGLDSQDALSMMRSLHVHGGTEELLAFMSQFDYHSLALSVVAGRIASYRQNPGDFSAWYRSEGAHLRLADLSLVQRRTHILEYALRGLTPKQRLLLGRMAAFRYPVEFAALKAINPFLLAARAESPGTSVRRRQWLYNLFGHTRSSGVPEESSGHEQQSPTPGQGHVVTASQERMLRTEASLHTALEELEDRGLLQWDRNV